MKQEKKNPKPQTTPNPKLLPRVADCVCKAGFHGTISSSSDSCTQCPAGSYCAGGSALATCPSNSDSPEQAFALTACVCVAGYYGPQGGPCAQCLAG